MKSRLFSLIFSLFVVQLLSAQSGAPKTNTTPSDPEVRKATETLVLKYSLNADQAKQLYKIQVRKNKNMAEIAKYQTTDIALYQAKWRNVQKGTWASIRSILNTKGQVEIYQKTQSELRGLRNTKRKELTVKKESKEAIEAAVLSIYAE